MAHYFIFPDKDTTLYSHPDRARMNAGYDEILEIVKEKGSTTPYHYPSRILIGFKNEDINTALSLMGHDVFTSSLSEVRLQLTTSNTKNLTSTHNINVYAVSQSWTEGTGRYLNLPTGSNGVSWEYRNDSTLATPWTGSGTAANLFGTGVWGTGSIDSSVMAPQGTDPETYALSTDQSASLITPGGGTWYTGSEFQATQQFLAGDSFDTDFDVRNIIHKFSASINNQASIPDGIENHGFLIKTPDSVEESLSSSFGEIQYFSSNTHTIYPPKLVFKWDDSSYSIGDSEAKSGSLFVSLYNNQKEYNQNDEVIFRIHVREKYPTRQFTTTSNYLNLSYLATSSFYSVRDAHSEREIIPFDNYTKLSADTEGMYFKLHMKGLQPERYYRLLFKHTHNDGTTIYDNDYYFKVVR